MAERDRRGAGETLSGEASALRLQEKERLSALGGAVCRIRTLSAGLLRLYLFQGGENSEDRRELSFVGRYAIKRERGDRKWSADFSGSFIIWQKNINYLIEICIAGHDI